jgi:hypothetical protein
MKTIKSSFVSVNILMLLISGFVFLTGCTKYVRLVSQYDNGRLTSRELRSCSGKILELTLYENGKVFSQGKYTYSNGFLIQSVFLQYDNTSTSIDYVYNNNLLLTEDYKYNNEIIKIIEYSYDKNSLHFRKIIRNLPGNTSTIIEHRYDEQKRLVEINTIVQDVTSEKVLYQFDQNNNVVREIKLVYGDTISRINKVYDQANRMIELTEFSEGMAIQNILYTYNNRHQILKAVHLNDEGFVVRTEKYNYNMNGLKKAINIKDFRNYEGSMQAHTDIIRFRYKYY